MPFCLLIFPPLLQYRPNDKITPYAIIKNQVETVLLPKWSIMSHFMCSILKVFSAKELLIIGWYSISSHHF